VFPYDKNSRNIIFRIGHPFLTISRKKKKHIPWARHYFYDFKSATFLFSKNVPGSRHWKHNLQWSPRDQWNRLTFSLLLFDISPLAVRLLRIEYYNDL
jgi:hypothetical protein